MSRPARWECPRCRRLLGEVLHDQLRLGRSVETVYLVTGGCAVVCPGCEEPRVWTWEKPTAMTSADT